jgi:soluble lytic murein transglycosylase-like protein
MPVLSFMPVSLRNLRPNRNAGRRTACLALLGGLLVHGPVLADVYKYQDGNGVTHLTNVPEEASRGPYELWKKSEATKPKGWQDGYRALPRLDRQSYAETVARFSGLYGVDPTLVRAVIHAESAFRPDAVSPKGAGGLMQLMPATAQRFDVSDRFDPEQNIAGGVAYLALLLDLFDGDRQLAVAAYNAGENAVARYDGIPPYEETQTYVKRVMQLQAAYAGNG